MRCRRRRNATKLWTCARRRCGSDLHRAATECGGCWAVILVRRDHDGGGITAVRWNRWAGSWSGRALISHVCRAATRRMEASLAPTASELAAFEAAERRACIAPIQGPLLALAKHQSIRSTARLRADWLYASPLCCRWPASNFFLPSSSSSPSNGCGWHSQDEPIWVGVPRRLWADFNQCATILPQWVMGVRTRYAYMNWPPFRPDTWA